MNFPESTKQLYWLGSWLQNGMETKKREERTDKERKDGGRGKQREKAADGDSPYQGMVSSPENGLAIPTVSLSK